MLLCGSAKSEKGKAACCLTLPCTASFHLFVGRWRWVSSSCWSLLTPGLWKSKVPSSSTSYHLVVSMWGWKLNFLLSFADTTPVKKDINTQCFTLAHFGLLVTSLLLSQGGNSAPHWAPLTLKWACGLPTSTTSHHLVFHGKSSNLAFYCALLKPGVGKAVCQSVLPVCCWWECKFSSLLGSADTISAIAEF